VSSPHLPSRGFTLVELMAAMTVLSLLMVALVAMLDQVL
jgi:prepilin-type N-terminal cleavage/methylation domain-containing protein